MGATERMLQPVGKGDPDRAKNIALQQIVDIHVRMGTEIQRVLEEFRELPWATVSKTSPKQRESIAELIVSTTIEWEFGIYVEDLEQAIVAKEAELSEFPEFAQASQ